MSSPPPAPRSARARDTRRRVEEAASGLFIAHGYSATSMQAIADEAGVHVQTIYLAYGTKASVLAAAATRLVAGDDDPASHPGERAWARAILASEDPRRKIALYVEHIADVAPRTTALIDALRATARSEPEVGAFLERMEEGRREGPLALLGPLAGAGLVRAGLSAADIADITFALASPDTLRALTVHRGWPRERATAWLTAALTTALLP